MDKEDVIHTHTHTHTHTYIGLLLSYGMNKLMNIEIIINLLYT